MGVQPLGESADNTSRHPSMWSLGVPERACKSSNWWYGVFVVDGVRTVINLGIPITGQRPPKRTMIGDDEFERSRGRAMILSVPSS